MHFQLSALAQTALAQGGPRQAIAYGGTWRSAEWVLSVVEAFEAQLGTVSTVGLVARNRPHHAILCAANIAARRTTVMIHCAQSAVGLARDIRKLALPAIIADREDWSVEAIAAARAAGSLAIATNESPGAASLEMLVPAREASCFRLKPDIALELLSSGTTGAPKRVGLSWHAISQAVEQAGHAYAGSDAASPQIMVHPLGNVAGLAYAVPPMVFERPLVLLDRFTAKGWAEAVRTYRPTRGTVPPAGIAMLLASDVPAEWLSSLDLVAVGGGKLPVEQQDAFEDRFKRPVLTAYGATEFGGVVANWSLDLYREFGLEKRGSAGRASAGVALRIIDAERGHPLETFSTGLLEVRTSRVSEHWIRTTDLARIDADGFLFLEGRADAAINRGGFKIVPEALSDVVRQYPGVRDVAVVGIPDHRLGEVPVTAIEPEPGAVLDGDRVLAWLRDRVPAYQLPVAIRIVAALPRNASLKISIVEVRALFAESPTAQDRK